MNRRLLLKNAVGLGLGLNPVLRLTAGTASHSGHVPVQHAVAAGPRKPLTIYNNWSAYDELSDNIPLTEELAMKELNELIRLKKSGVAVDYYVMDAFWFDKAGGYRTWHKERWPNGPDKWISTCISSNIKPGMWFSTNDRIASPDGFFLDLIPEWKDSATTMPKALSLFRGGYLKHLFETLQMWYDKGVRAFKFDFARFNAADEASHQLYLENEIVEMNKVAFIDALKQFREKNPEVLFIGYNGFGGEMSNTYTPFRKSVEDRWLQAFDTLYCGDPRFSDVPTGNIWRSQDIYSDHMVRQYQLNGLPLNRIDNCGFMIGVAGTCYKRALSAWKGMLILELARGGWVNVYHGNLELLTPQDAEWFARVQSMYMNLQQYGSTSTFGAMPGTRKAYGFAATGSNGTVCTVVNPSQAFADLDMPAASATSGAVLYTDGGFKPVLKGSRVTLGPEQMAVIGFGAYADGKFQLGVDETIRIPLAIDPVGVNFTTAGTNTIIGTVRPPEGKNLRILVQQFGADNFPHRSSGGPPPNGKNMDTIIQIFVTQSGKPVKVNKQYDKMIWSGLSWGAVEIESGAVKSSLPIQIKCTSLEKETLTLKAEVFAFTH